MTDDKLINDETNNQVLSHPDIKGWVAIRNDGTQNVASDKNAEELGNVLIYFCDVSGMIGETFGLGRADEVHIVCDQSTTVCLPGDKETVGVIFDKDTSPNQFLAKYNTVRK